MDYLSISELPYVKELENDEVVYIKANGSWEKYPRWFPRRLQAQLREFTKLLDNAEKIPLLIDKTNRKYPQALTVQARYLDAAIALESYVLRHGYPKTDETYHQYKLRLLALMYRLEEIRRTDFDLALYNLILPKAQAWKKNEIAYWTTKLTFHEENTLKNCCEFPHYIKEILKNPKSLNLFFKWVLRDGISLEPLIEYPAMTKILSKSLLVGRISRHGGKGLKIQEIEVSNENAVVEKILTLPFEGKDANILDFHKKITFRGNYTLTIDEILNVFGNKKYATGNLEYMGDGIINWNTFKLAYWDALEQHFVAIDLLCDKWWEQLPAFETISSKKARDKYGPHLDGTNWNFAIRASRADHSLNFEKCHAYLEIAIPVDKDHYRIYDFGKFATWFPKNQWDKLLQFSVFAPAVIAFPDENVFYTHRQHVNFSHEVTPAEGKVIMELIKNDMLEARKGNIFFQIETENCGRWIHGILSKGLGAERVPNHFKLPLFETEPKGPVKWIFEMCKKLPAKIGTKIVMYLHLPLGAWKGVYKSDEGKKSHMSLATSSFWNDTVVYLPAMLHRKYEQEHISEVLEVRIQVNPPK